VVILLVVVAEGRVQRGLLQTSLCRAIPRGFVRVPVELHLDGLVSSEHDDVGPYPDMESAILGWLDLDHSAGWSTVLKQQVADVQHTGGDDSGHWFPFVALALIGDNDATGELVTSKSKGGSATLRSRAPGSELGGFHRLASWRGIVANRSLLPNRLTTSSGSNQERP
jgi:hypothetical protein